MTDPLAITIVFSSLVSLLLLLYFFFWLYRDYRMDLLRQRLFALRDELFDLAQGGAVSFDHPAYGLLRTTLNGFIRFGGRLGMVLVLWLVWRRPDKLLEESGDPGFFQRWLDSRRELDEQTTQKLDGIMTRMHVAVLEHLVYTSLTLLVALVPLIAVGFLELGRRRFLTSIRSWKAWPALRSRWLEPLDAAALTVGTL